MSFLSESSITCKHTQRYAVHRRQIVLYVCSCVRVHYQSTSVIIMQVSQNVSTYYFESVCAIETYNYVLDHH